MHRVWRAPSGCTGIWHRTGGCERPIDSLIMVMTTQPARRRASNARSISKPRPGFIPGTPVTSNLDSRSRTHTHKHIQGGGRPKHLQSCSSDRVSCTAALQHRLCVCEPFFRAFRPDDYEHHHLRRPSCPTSPSFSMPDWLVSVGTEQTGMIGLKGSLPSVSACWDGTRTRRTPFFGASCL